MARVIENKPIMSLWLGKYGFEYDSNCRVGSCRGFERYYDSATDPDEITWVTISFSNKTVYIGTENKHIDGIFANQSFAIPENINPNNESEFINWLDSIVG